MRKLSLLAVVTACGCAAPESEDIASEQARIVYGDDDRRDYFDVEDSGVRDLIARSTVTLVPNVWLDRESGTLSPEAPAWGELTGACPDQRLSAEPGVAFCTGVLVDWDLVLTAGHCLRAFALEDFTVLFDYYYAEEQSIALSRASRAVPEEIVAEALDPADATPRLDYAWIRLSKPVPATRLPVPIYRQIPVLAQDDPFITIGSPGGAPLKLDATAVIDDPRDGDDYFLARADDSGGWSGGGAFDDTLALFAILSRGGEDFLATEDCGAEQQVRESDPAQEAFSYVAPALDELCRLEPTRSLCRADCAEPCQALPLKTPRHEHRGGGCSLDDEPTGTHAFGPLTISLLVLVGATLRRRSI